MLEKAIKYPKLHLKEVKRKQTRPNLIKVPQKQIMGNSAGYQQKPFYQQQVQHYKGASFQQKKGAHPSKCGPQTQYFTGQKNHQHFQKKEKQGWSILKLHVKKQGFMKNILELGSFLSLSRSLRSSSGVWLGRGFGWGTPPPKMSGKVDS